MSGDPMEYVYRARLVKLRLERVADEARRAFEDGRFDRVDALAAESELLLEQMRSIHEEQLIALLPKPELERPARRGLWRRVLHRKGD